MRNLGNVRFGRSRHQNITAACWDPETDEVICTLGPSETSPSIQLVRITDGDTISHRQVAAWDAPSPHPNLAVDTVLSLHHLSGTGTTVIILQGGDIVTVRDDQVEIVGSIDAGIAAAAWSPDEELLLVVTKDANVVFMGSAFDPVSEVPMTSKDLNASRQVSVGWGKKETQFEGRGAKALRDPTIPERVDQGLPSANDDGATTVSWRGDGAYAAVNSTVGGRRVIRVYSREGELDGVSEAVDGLEGALSWRPAGNLMAGVQRKGDSVDVVFFERNGLRHGEFTLRSPGRSVTAQKSIRLEWNLDSTVLAVILDDVIQFWTMGNYHWYLKQETPMDPNLVTFAWHPEKALRLAAASSGGVILAEEIFHTTRGTTHPPGDDGAVAVIDGDTVKLTPFRTANVPPPMSLFDITVEASVVDVAFGRQNRTFAVLHHKGVDLFEWPTKNGRPTMPKVLSKVLFESADISEYHVPLRIRCVDEGTFRCISYQDLGQLDISVKVEGGMSVIDEKQLIASTATYEDESSVESYGQDQKGRLFRLFPSSTEPCQTRFPIQLPWFEVTKTNDVLVAFGLSRSGHLYADTKILAKNCTSFAVTPSHLIYTTNNHFIKFVHLASTVDDLEVPADDPERDERCRSVERGSRIVTAIPTNMSVVLQMPRGNVETIHPRAMVVAGIRTLIDEKNYARAFAYCRTQRVDMNILYDHAPAQFLEHVSLFLGQLKETSYIDLFLSALRNEDVTQTMYQDTKRRTTSPYTPPTTKVNTICDAVLKSLLPQKATRLQNIISAHVCKVPPALDDGLTLVAGLLSDEAVAGKAVEHICFLVDVNRLYENALGLYNLDLALLVAQQSQRDPREYLPFIQHLHSLPLLRRHFEIDDHLARHVKALIHLQSLDFDELCTYTIKHALFQDALRLYRYDAPRHDTITLLYAAHLESTSSFREAGLAYESLSHYKKATACYRAAGATCWQEALFAAQQTSPPPSADAMAELAESLADALSEAKDFLAAATIHERYLASLPGAIKLLCRGYHFADALRLISLHQRPDLLATTLDTGLADALSSTTEFLADCKNQLAAQLPRIALLRTKALEDPLAFYEGDRPGGADIPDDISVAASSRISTSASLFTRYTGKDTGTIATGASRATSKARKREEKKRARGRKGTVYEEEYLVNSVRRLVERVSGGATGEVERLVFALARRGMAERARAVEALLADVTGACGRAVEEVFGREEEVVVEEGAAKGGDAVLAEWASRPVVSRPAVPKMARLALLG